MKKSLRSFFIKNAKYDKEDFKLMGSSTRKPKQIDRRRLRKKQNTMWKRELDRG